MTGQGNTGHRYQVRPERPGLPCKNLLKRHHLDLDLDAGGLGELALDVGKNVGRWCRLRGIADLGTTKRLGNVLQPLCHLVIRREGRITDQTTAVERTGGTQKTSIECGKTNARHAHLLQKFPFCYAAGRKLLCGIDYESLFIMSFKAHCFLLFSRFMSSDF